MYHFKWLCVLVQIGVPLNWLAGVFHLVLKMLRYQKILPSTSATTNAQFPNWWPQKVAFQQQMALDHKRANATFSNVVGSFR